MALVEMGFHEKAELGSGGARIRKRTEYKESQEEYEYPERSTQGIKTHEGRERKKTKKKIAKGYKTQRAGVKENTERNSRRMGQRRKIAG